MCLRIILLRSLILSSVSYIDIAVLSVCLFVCHVHRTVTYVIPVLSSSTARGRWPSHSTWSVAQSVPRHVVGGPVTARGRCPSQFHGTWWVSSHYSFPSTRHLCKIPTGSHSAGALNTGGVVPSCEKLYPSPPPDIYASDGRHLECRNVSCP